MIYIALILVAIPIGMFSLGAYLSGPRYRGKRTDHFDGKRFLNPGGVKAKGGMEVFKWMIRRKPGRWPKEVEAPWGKRPLAHYKDGIRITFVNHSTFLIQVARTSCI